MQKNQIADTEGKPVHQEPDSCGILSMVYTYTVMCAAQDWESFMKTTYNRECSIFTMYILQHVSSSL